MRKFTFFVVILFLISAMFSNVSGITISKKWSINLQGYKHHYAEFFANSKFYLKYNYNKLWCIDILTGTKLWEIDSGDILDIFSNKVFVSNGNFPATLSCYEENTGKLLWKVVTYEYSFVLSSDSVYTKEPNKNKQMVIRRYDFNGRLSSTYFNPKAKNYLICKLDGNKLIVNQMLDDYKLKNIYLDRYSLKYLGIADYLHELNGLLHYESFSNYCVTVCKKSNNAREYSLYDKTIQIKYWSFIIQNEEYTDYCVFREKSIFFKTYNLNLDIEKLYCVNINTGKILWSYSQKYYPYNNIFIFKNHITITERDSDYKFLNIYTIDKSNGKIIYRIYFNKQYDIYTSVIINEYLYIKNYQNGKIILEIRNMGDNKIINTIETSNYSCIKKVFANNLLIVEDETFYLFNISNGQRIYFENCNDLLSNFDNQFIFFNDRDKTIECHVTTGDL